MEKPSCGGAATTTDGTVSLVYRPEPGGVPPLPSEIGGKAHHLARLASLGENVPLWVVVRARAFDCIVGRHAEIRALDLPTAFRSEVLAALDAAGLREARLAVRSSAVAEDAAEASFAGQFDSVLGVRPGPDGAALWEAIRRVWASAFNARVAAYQQRRKEGGGLLPPRMAVILQEMVDASASGVAFSLDPVTGARDTAVVSAVYGLGEGLVSGALDADSYWVRFDDHDPQSDAGTAAWSQVGRRPPCAIRRDLVRKDRALRLMPEGGTRVETVAEALREASVLTDADAERVATTARRLADALGGPQDVEWAFADPCDPGDGRLWILQSRPATAVGSGPTASVALPAASGERLVWDNSNIVESYAGVTTPLTFSFARSVYEHVYRQFCRLMGIGEPLIEAHEDAFAHMLGLVRGRVYYNLLNWYRALALLPGYTCNRAFMERMMGVRQRLEDPPDPPHVAGRGEDLVRLVRMVGRLLREHRRLPREVTAFHAQIEIALAPLAREELSTWPLQELTALYQRLEGSLLRQWRAPLVNDFFTMISFGVLARLIERWLPDASPKLVNDLLCGEGGMISTEPARQVMTLARQVTDSPDLAALFAREQTDDALWRQITAMPEHEPLHRALRTYLDRFGDRCMNELKLETVTLSENPVFLLQMIRACARAGTMHPEAAHRREKKIRAEAEAWVSAHLGPPRRWLLMAVLKQTRRRVRDRENLRFERTRVFALVRRIFRAIGDNLAASAQLAAPRDIFYLTKEEIFGYLTGTAVTADLNALVTLRRAEFARYEREPPLPDRFETVGPPSGAPVRRPAAAASAQARGELVGTGCCPGIVRAPVRVVRDPRELPGDPAGQILVAERTDPGWALLFPAARGLLVQRGSLLSHSAIVAREMGLPCIVGVAHLLETLRDGEWVEMDGTTGVIRRLPRAGA